MGADKLIKINSRLHKEKRGETNILFVFLVSISENDFKLTLPRTIEGCILQAMFCRSLWDISVGSDIFNNMWKPPWS